MKTFEQYLKENLIDIILFNINKKYKCDMRGSCDWVAEELTKQLINNNIKDFKIIEGWVDLGGGIDAHTWIELKDGTILDPTKNQFPREIQRYRKEEEFSYHTPDSGKTLKYKTRIFTPKEYIEYAKKHFPATPKRKVLK